MTEKEFLNQQLHLIKLSAQCFKDVAIYIRQRDKCPSKEVFERGIKVLDRLAENLYKRIKDEK